MLFFVFFLPFEHRLVEWDLGPAEVIEIELVLTVLLDIQPVDGKDVPLIRYP